MKCGFKTYLQCTEECPHFHTCTRNPRNNKKEEPLIKDRECVSCTKLFDCKGKRRGIQCLNYEERKRDGRC